VLIAACIVVNTVLLGLDKYPQPEAHENALELANLFFYAVFLAEMIIKLLGFGYTSYFKVTENKFDAVIVFLSTSDVVLFILDQVQK
jgi:hypothetical protein